MRFGWGFYRARFLVSPEWAAPGRRFEVDDTDGWFGMAGVDLRLRHGLGMEGAYRYSGVDDVQARAYLRPNRFRPGAFPMRSHAATLGVRYTF